MATRKKDRQVKFYCDQDVFDRLQSEKVKDGTSIQAVVLKAVELLFSVSAAEAYLASRDGRRMLTEVPAAKLKQEIRKHFENLQETLQPLLTANARERHGLEMWLSCLRTLPTETVEAHMTLMQDTLRFFRSARLKAENEAENKAGERSAADSEHASKPPKGTRGKKAK